MKSDLVLILPNIRSCHNVGAMFRTADGCGFNKIYLVGYTPMPPRPEIDKVALGAEKTVPWEHHELLDELISGLKKQGYMIVALEKTETSTDIGVYELSRNPVALIVGNEVDGIEEEVLAHVDAVVHIPMHGTKESLNVSIAAGIGMYEISRKVRK